MAQGLYDPANEKDACGVGLLVNVGGVKSHRLVEQGLQVLEHMVHRGAEGADPKTGDGAGIMVQVPHEYILLQGIAVPEKGRYGTGLVFLPRDEQQIKTIIDIIARETTAAGLTFLPVRKVPVNDSHLGKVAKDAQPEIVQIFIADTNTSDDIEPKLYLLRKAVEKRVAAELGADSGFYVVSLSSRVIVYKGMLSSLQLRYYYPDLTSPHFTSAMALVHSRFSTNTFPTWALAQPFRMLGHNGEINTIRGNRLWMTARECLLKPAKLGNVDLTPILQPDMSDSASLDNALEFFVMSGMSLPHALAMLVPESFNEKNPISPELKAFYEFHSILMEAWDGPATLLFSDGRYAGGMLDRNGLRPGRYILTKDDTLVIASEAGVLPIDASEVKEKGRLRPGKMLMVDMEERRIYRDDELKEALASEFPFRDWLSRNRIVLDNINSGRKVENNVTDYRRLLDEFLYNREEIEKIMMPMAADAKEPVNSMGNDTPLAVLSAYRQPLFNYFRQHFAQVTNPPIDPLREELVMSLDSYIGAIKLNLLEPTADHCKMVELKRPILTNRELDLLCNLRYKGFNTRKIAMTFKVADGESGLREGIDRVCREAETAVDEGCNYIVLTDRGVTAEDAPIPSLLATSAVHHHLIKMQKRVQTALIIETAEVREVMHFALLSGYGASAVNPYLAFAVLDNLVKKGELQLDFETAQRNYIKAVDKGLLKVMSKMGISTLTSYKGSLQFEAIGIGDEMIENYFGQTVSKIGGLTLSDVSRMIAENHSEAFGDDFDEGSQIRHKGMYAWRKDGEDHAWNPETITALQLATRLGSYKKFKEFTSLVDNKKRPMFIRDLLDFKKMQPSIPVDEVEPEEAIMRRFVTGAMSFGSISREAHEALAIAMNTIGARSNTGEGGEDSERFKPLADGRSARSAIKQVASGRFGVTAEYLVNADEIQIKIAQGAKPGEGGQLPGFKVDKIIAKTRNSIPGISLISPPPHHDIYSIEDLAQLIFDLKNVNPRACVSVKLVSESGVGTIAAGVAKAKSDLITISGAEGGTGASPASSIRYAGLPSEIGLAETQQTLVINNLRGQVKLQVDGQLKTARDVLVMAMLGAEEFGFATSALIVLGCVMMRKCHLNTCPVGVATQNEELRKRFIGRSEYVVNFFRFLAREIRETMASLGIRRMDEIIGRADLLCVKNEVKLPYTSDFDLSKILYVPAEASENAILNVMSQKHDIETVLDRELIARSYNAIETGAPVELEFPVSNTDRAVGAMLSGEIAAKFGAAGLPDDTITAIFNGSAGQSFGAFLAHGVTFRLLGEANDYVGKGLSGGKIIISPAPGATFEAENNIIAGNTLLYGATSGEVYINGRVGERFCVRNSGATAVVEGVGDHCCEYMTGGRTVVLGPTGRNFAAGMSGGVAYVWNPDGEFDYFCNMEMVELSLIEDMSDNRELHSLISNHYRYTGSSLAKRMLDDWNLYSSQFIKVIPYEYKQVLIAEKMETLRRKIENSAVQNN